MSLGRIYDNDILTMILWYSRARVSDDNAGGGGGAAGWGGAGALGELEPEV